MDLAKIVNKEYNKYDHMICIGHRILAFIVNESSIIIWTEIYHISLVLE